MTNKQLNTRIATNIRKYIGKNDITIAFLSRQLNMSYTGLMNILRGNAAPRASTTVKLCEILHCDPVDLYEPIYKEKAVKNWKEAEIILFLTDWSF